MAKLADYPFEVRPLTADEGGGYLVSYPDFAECISDGETVEEAPYAFLPRLRGRLTLRR